MATNLHFSSNSTTTTTTVCKRCAHTAVYNMHGVHGCACCHPCVLLTDVWPDPYFNEPGYESNAKTSRGQQQSTKYNQNLRLQTARWAPPDRFIGAHLPHLGLCSMESQQHAWQC